MRPLRLTAKVIIALVVSAPLLADDKNATPSISEGACAAAIEGQAEIDNAVAAVRWASGSTQTSGFYSQNPKVIRAREKTMAVYTIKNRGLQETPVFDLPYRYFSPAEPAENGAYTMKVQGPAISYLVPSKKILTARLVPTNNDPNGFENELRRLRAQEGRGGSKVVGVAPYPLSNEICILLEEQ